MATIDTIYQISGDIAAAYAACESKNAVMPEHQGTAQLSATIESIPAGGSTRYNVSIESFMPLAVAGQVQPAQMTPGALVLSGVTSVPQYQFQYVFGRANTNNQDMMPNISSLTVPDLSALTATYGFAYSFYNNPYIEEVNFPELTSVNSYSFNYAFRNCSKLKSVRFPKLKSPANSTATYCFQYMCHSCTNLESVDFGDYEFKNDYQLPYAFTSCTHLVDFHAPNMKYLHRASYTFDGCTSLSSIDFNELTNFGLVQYTFRNCSSLQEIRLPKCTTTDFAGTAPFQYCTSLSVFDAPVLTAFQQTSAFQGCSSLLSINLPKCTSWTNLTAVGTAGYGNISGCTSLKYVNLSSITNNTYYYNWNYLLSANMEEAWLGSGTETKNFSSYNSYNYGFGAWHKLKTLHLTKLKKLTGDNSYSGIVWGYGTSRQPSDEIRRENRLSLYFDAVTDIEGTSNNLAFYCGGTLGTLNNVDLYLPKLTNLDTSDDKIYLWGLYRLTSGQQDLTVTLNVHFPASMRSVVEAAPGYDVKFCLNAVYRDNVTLYFDL